MKKEKAYKLGVGQTRFRKRFRRRQRMRKIRSCILWMAGTVAACTCIALTGFHVSYASDTDMIGYIEQGETVITNKMSLLLREPTRGEVITCRLNVGGSSHTFQRRVIAFGGETVEISDGCLYINGQLCQEDYTEMQTYSSIGSFSVPPGCYFILSDNRDAGPDSRDGLYISKEDMIGSALEPFDIRQVQERLASLEDMALDTINTVGSLIR